MTNPASAEPLPVPDLDTAPYWDALRNGELRLQRCRRCDKYQHFPSPVCSTCLSFDLEFTPVSGRGFVYSFVVIHHATSPYFAGRAPYAVAWIELEEQPGLRVLSNIEGCEPAAITIGLEVQATFARVGADFDLVRFHPVVANETQPEKDVQ